MNNTLKYFIWFLLMLIIIIYLYWWNYNEKKKMEIPKQEITLYG